MPDTRTELRIEVAEALILKPGDRVLLLVNDGYLCTKAGAQEAQDLLRERFPDVEFTVATGVDRVAVELARAAEGDDRG